MIWCDIRDLASCICNLKICVFFCIRMGQLDRELKKQMEASEQEMRGLRNKTEASLEFLKQEQNIAASKVRPSTF